MKKSKMIDLMTNIVDKVEKDKPGILLGCAIVGIIITGYSAYKAGIKAKPILDKKKRDLSDIRPNDKEAKRAIIFETAKEMAPVVAPPVIMGTVSIACAVGSHSESMKRIALLSAAYNLSENTVKDLNNKMSEVLGDKKAKTIKDAIAKDKLDKNSSSLQKENIIITGNGDVPCYDTYSGRLFYSNSEKIGQAIQRLSADVIQDMYVSLNDFYSELGIERIPCICIDYDVSVRDDYRNLH